MASLMMWMRDAALAASFVAAFVFAAALTPASAFASGETLAGQCEGCNTKTCDETDFCDGDCTGDGTAGRCDEICTCKLGAGCPCT